ncbi:hypothetical protein C2G38_2035424 [Gigaspora rosea]|uniref:Uncharacterized protein n=1 Tax=Gigaspora rosea TaxID=44941 RepID=A0A397VE00_9GLOM|nr:hypothetical protein C2G38_2035424 [Gigaspora rosea]
MGNTNDENGLNKTPKNINDKNALLAQEIDDKKKKIPKDTTYEQVTELGDNKPISGERETPYLTIPSTNQRKKTNRQHQQRKTVLNDSKHQPAKKDKQATPTTQGTNQQKKTPTTNYLKRN